MQLCAPSSHLRCSTNEDWSIPDLEYRQASANHKDLEFFMRMIKRTFEICLVNSSPFYEKGQVAQDLQMTLSRRIPRLCQMLQQEVEKISDEDLMRRS